MGEVFVLLAGGAAFHILFQPLSCFGPEVVLLDFLYSFISSRVSVPVVPVMCDFFSDFFVWWDYKFIGSDCPPSAVFLPSCYVDW